MSVFCPICETECLDKAVKCDICGFADKIGIARSIATMEEAEYRLDMIIKPYRRYWELHQSHEKLSEKVDSLESLLSVLIDEFTFGKPGGFDLTRPASQMLQNKSHKSTPKKLNNNIRTISKATAKIINFASINWLVLDEQRSEMLLLSETILDKKWYHEKYTGITWVDCTLRKYLNNVFFDTFDRNDKLRIAETSINNPKNPWHGTNGGQDTSDRIFLLSIEEVLMYFGDSGQLQDENPKNKYWIKDEFNESRKALDSNSTSSSWWLRSPGSNSLSAASVSSDGGLGISGEYVNAAGGGIGVRPALWLKY